MLSNTKKPPQSITADHFYSPAPTPSVTRSHIGSVDPLMTVEEVAQRLKVSKDWVWDHSSRKTPRLPVIRMGDGTLRYRASGIEDFICERERLSALRYGTR